VQANFAGTFLAVLCVLFIPWALVSVVRGKFLWIVSFEGVFVRLLVLFLVVMLVRWIIVLLWQLLF
jgi:hypothetical protein